jgi:hypothetical protein
MFIGHIGMPGAPPAGACALAEEDAGAGRAGAADAEGFSDDDVAQASRAAASGRRRVEFMRGT